MGGRFIQSFATAAEKDQYVIPETINSGDWYLVDDDETHEGHKTKYVATDASGSMYLEYAGIDSYDPVGLATETTAGISKGSDIDGQIFYESDGTGSVVGWDALKQRVTTIEADALELAFYNGYTTTTTISTIPITKRSVLANLTTSGTLSLSGVLPQGKELSIKARNTSSAEITITLTNDATWESKKPNGDNIDSVKISAAGAIEINIWALDKRIIKTDA